MYFKAPIRTLSIILSLSLCFSCRSKPSAQPQPETQSCLIQGWPENKTVWHFESGGGSSKLGKILPASGERKIVATNLGTDLGLFKISKNRLAILSRPTATAPSLTLLDEATGATTFTTPLRTEIAYSNPQRVLEDDEGRLWITFLNLDQIMVLDPFSKANSKLITLDKLKENCNGLPGDCKNAELNAIASVTPTGSTTSEIWVGSQNLRRDQNWYPTATSGLARINPKTLEVIDQMQVPISNLSAIHARTVGSGGGAILVGSGSLFSKDEKTKAFFTAGSSVILTNPNSQQINMMSDVKKLANESRILMSQYDSSNDTRYEVHWINDSNCLVETRAQNSSKNILCVPGAYSFTAMAITDSFVVLNHASSGGQRNEILFINTDTGRVQACKSARSIQSLEIVDTRG